MTNTNDRTEKTFPELDEEINNVDIDFEIINQQIPKTRKFKVPDPKFSTQFQQKNALNIETFLGSDQLCDIDYLTKHIITIKQGIKLIAKSNKHQN